MALEPSAYKLDITSDKMEASFHLLKPPDPGTLTVDQLLATLQAHKVTYGIDQAALELIASKQQLNTPQVVARGQKAVDGSPEEVEYRFDASGPSLAEDQDTGSIDFRSLSNFNNTKEGTILAVKKPSTEGRIGRDVLGNEYKAREGKKINLRTGKGAAVTEDGMAVVAEVSGHACLMGDKISVLSTIDIAADVDYSVGNINFIGDVRIRGGVLPGFSVVAEGSVDIGGNVEKATIKCSGNLSIRGLVFGQGACEIVTKGDAAITAIDQAELSIGGDLTIANYIRHCKANVGGMVHVTSKKGNIVGGEIAAFRGINAPFIGNHMATLTKLTVGSNPFISGELDTLRNHLAEMETKLNQVNTAITAISVRVRAGQADATTEGMLEKLKRAKEQLDPEVAALTQKLAQLDEQMSDFKDARIRISEIVYPGVVINFRDRLQYKTMDEAQRLTFYEENAEIRTGPY